MDRTSIRAWRRIQEKRVWRNRIKYYANMGNQIVDAETHQRRNPRDWKEYRKEHWMLKLKDTATICSCWMCRTSMIAWHTSATQLASFKSRQMIDSLTPQYMGNNLTYRGVVLPCPAYEYHPFNHSLKGKMQY